MQKLYSNSFLTINLLAQGIPSLHARMVYFFLYPLAANKMNPQMSLVSMQTHNFLRNMAAVQTIHSNGQICQKTTLSFTSELAKFLNTQNYESKHGTKYSSTVFNAHFYYPWLLIKFNFISAIQGPSTPTAYIITYHLLE